MMMMMMILWTDMIVVVITMMIILIIIIINIVTMTIIIITMTIIIINSPFEKVHRKLTLSAEILMGRGLIGAAGMVVKVLYVYSPDKVECMKYINIYIYIIYQSINQSIQYHLFLTIIIIIIIHHHFTIIHHCHHNSQLTCSERIESSDAEAVAHPGLQLVDPEAEREIPVYLWWVTAYLLIAHFTALRSYHWA